MSTRGRQLAKLLIRIVVTAGLLLWAFSQVDLADFGQTVKAARWEYLAVVWVWTAFLFWVRSVKMRLVLKQQGCDVGVGTLFGATTVTAFYSMILPGVLSTGVKWYILKKITGRGSAVFSSMLYNQLLTVVVMTVFGLAALTVTNPISLLFPGAQSRWPLPVVCSLVLVAVMLVTMLLLNARTGGMFITMFKRMLKPLGSAVHQKGQDVLDQIASFQTAGVGFHMGITSLTIADTLVGGVIGYVLSAKAANIVAPVGLFVWLCAIIYVLGRLPISIANLGVRESVLVSLLAVYGVDKSAALLMSMILFSRLVVMAIVGAAYQISWTVSERKGGRPSGKGAQ
jgi:uncharacterized membrane protein YbhN (UPF0104 family)